MPRFVSFAWVTGSLIVAPLRAQCPDGSPPPCTRIATRTPAAARQDSAARAAGYASADAIGPYLRTLIASHHDTLARAVR